MNSEAKYIAEEIAQVVRKVSGISDADIPLHLPYTTKQDNLAIDKCFLDNWFAVNGPSVAEFERKLTQFTGLKYAIATNSGTAALHTLLHCTGKVLPDTEVLLPSLTFIATANAVSYCGAIPHFVDCEESTLGIHFDKLEDYLSRIAVVSNKKLINKETGRVISALVLVHILGHPADCSKAKELCNKYNLVLLEDCAGALGSYYKGKHVGSYGEGSILSFNGNKIITTGGGGAILTNSKVYAEKARFLVNTAKSVHPWKYKHKTLGFNYGMPNLNAALGVGQFSHIQSILDAKQKLADDYIKEFESSSFLFKASFEPSSKVNYWLNAVQLKQEDAQFLEEVVEALHQLNIFCRPIWKPLHTLPLYQNNPRMSMEKTEKLAKQLICIPSFPYKFLTNQSDSQKY